MTNEILHLAGGLVPLPMQVIIIDITVSASFYYYSSQQKTENGLTFYSKLSEKVASWNFKL